MNSLCLRWEVSSLASDPVCTSRETISAALTLRSLIQHPGCRRPGEERATTSRALRTLRFSTRDHETASPPVKTGVHWDSARSLLPPIPSRFIGVNSNRARISSLYSRWFDFCVYTCVCEESKSDTRLVYIEKRAISAALAVVWLVSRRPLKSLSGRRLQYWTCYWSRASLQPICACPCKCVAFHLRFFFLVPLDGIV